MICSSRKGALLFNHQDLRSVAYCLSNKGVVQRPRHAELRDANAGLRQIVDRRKTQFAERFADVDIRFASCNDDQPRFADVDDHAVDAVGCRKGNCKAFLRRQTLLLRQRRVSEANVRPFLGRDTNRWLNIAMPPAVHGYGQCAVHHIGQR